MTERPLKVRGWCSCAYDEVRIILELEADRADAVRWADAFIGAHAQHDGFRFEIQPIGFAPKPVRERFPADSGTDSGSNDPDEAPNRAQEG